MLLIAISALAAPPRGLELSTAYRYEQYVRDFGKNVALNTAEWELRETIFNTRVREFIAFNKLGGTYWKGVNKFTDMTDKERRAFLGGRPTMNRFLAKESGIFSEHKWDGKALPDSVDWRTKNVLTDVKDQGGCGSCWAHAATEAMEASAAINSQKPPQVLSRQQVTACTPNPNQCGGTGGCGGATAELGFAYIQSATGITTEDAYPYTAAGACQWPGSFPVVAKVTSFSSTTVNDVNGTLSMVATMGPPSIGVAANKFFDYGGGIFNGCEADSDQDMNHGVQLVGYGKDFFIVRNSWGSGWGEDGYIRIHRVDKCYTDNESHDGSACKGDPDKIQVCGPCGLYYEVSWPVSRFVN